MHTVEIKLRFENENMTWEDRKVITAIQVTSINGLLVRADDHSVRLSDAVRIFAESVGAVESRWNFGGSNQGHYNFV